MEFGFKMERMARMVRCCMASVWMALAAANVMAAAPEVIRAEFGLFTPKDSSDLQFEPTRIVPHKVGTRYGWVIELRTKARAVSVSEEYILPPLTETKPDPLAEALGLKNERRNQVSQRRLVPVEGKIYGEWEIGPQEPAGKRTLQVIVEGAEPVRFEYEVK